MKLELPDVDEEELEVPDPSGPKKRGRKRTKPIKETAKAVDKFAPFVPDFVRDPSLLPKRPPGR